MTDLTCGLLFALCFVAIRGYNSTNYFFAKSEFPDMALVAMTSFVSFVVATTLSFFVESANWSKIYELSSVRWTVIAGSLSVASVFFALKSYSFIPQWLTQSFIGLEPVFGFLGIWLISRVTVSSQIQQAMTQRLPHNYVQFFLGLMLIISGVVLLSFSRAK